MAEYLLLRFLNQTMPKDNKKNLIILTVSAILPDIQPIPDSTYGCLSSIYLLTHHHPSISSFMKEIWSVPGTVESVDMLSE